MINLRNALMAGKRLPYDAEVEYLESTGTQYINTGVYPGIGDVLECTFKLGSITTYGALFGCSWTSDGVLPAVWIKSTSKIHALYCGDSFESSTNTYSTGDVLNLDVSLQSNSLSTYINGVPLRKAKGSASFPSIPYHIFCTTNASGSAPYNAAGSGTKCYGFRIYKDDVLVRDFIPVRVGTVGYLYDRVSGQLFRNQGNGTFVIGPDASATPTARDYVQDGLVAMWDGIENAGWGVHDTNVGAVNLAGDAELIFPTNLANWSMGARSFDLSLIYHTDLRASLTIPANTFAMSQFSTEICISRGSDSTGDGEFGLVQSGTSFLTELKGDSTALFRAFNSEGGLTINTAPNVGATTSPKTLAFTYDGTTSRFYANGMQSTSAAMALRAAFNAGLVRIGSTYLYNSGSIFSIRIYSRALTAEESAANYAIDKARFGLPDAS